MIETAEAAIPKGNRRRRGGRIWPRSMNAISIQNPSRIRDNEKEKFGPKGFDVLKHYHMI